MVGFDVGADLYTRNYYPTGPGGCMEPCQNCALSRSRLRHRQEVTDYPEFPPFKGVCHTHPDKPQLPVWP